MITLNNVNKTFKNKIETHALKNISLKLEDHTIIGLIGANGAGKSTLMKLIAQQIKPTSGEIILEPHYTDYTNICLMSDVELLFQSYSLNDLYKFFPEFYPEFNLSIAKKIVKLLNVNENKNFEKLSKGQKGKANLALALASRAYITLIDETYISLDAPSRHKLFDIILEEFNDFPRTFIISTHYVDEVSKLFDDIVLIHEGELIVHESKDTIEEKAKTLFGPVEVLDPLLSSKKILHKEVIGKRCFYSIFDTLEDLVLPEEIDISLTPVEKWFIHMIGGAYEH